MLACRLCLIHITRLMYFSHDNDDDIIHWGKADARNCNYGHPKMADVESGKNLLGD